MVHMQCPDYSSRETLLERHVIKQTRGIVTSSRWELRADQKIHSHCPCLSKNHGTKLAGVRYLSIIPFSLPWVVPFS